MTSGLTPQLDAALGRLNEAQRRAVDWRDGAMLLLAGPGSGKTTVLTARLATLVQSTPKERFRVLALTFTNLAAAEMADRVTQLMGEQARDRMFIGTFHAFCIDVLQNHGSQIGLRSGFRVFGQEADREAVLTNALYQMGEEGRFETRRILAAIDRLRSRLVTPEDAANSFRDPDQGAFVARVYAAYEMSLADAQALDFNGILMQTWRLFRQLPTLAQRYQRTFKYWMIDEFQDTNRAQYGLLKALAGNEFRNLFLVADDDQIIYRWNGASYQQLDQFRRDFSPVQLQLPESYRCPPAVVAAANALISHNSERTVEKAEITAGKTTPIRSYPAIEVRSYKTDQDEREGIADEIGGLSSSDKSHVVVLARNKYLLEGCHVALTNRGIPSAIVSRRDDFLSPAYRWIQSILRQLVRPQDTRNLQTLITAFAELSEFAIDIETVTDAQVESGKSLLQTWIDMVRDSPDTFSGVLSAAEQVSNSPNSWRSFVTQCTDEWRKIFGGPGELPIDVEEDAKAWREIAREIDHAIGKAATLDEFLHRLDIVSKDPTPSDGVVRLMTIHGAKGKEFKIVFLMGLAEGELPSWHSLRQGADAELEEERRSCFVAITRTEERLILTRASQYRNQHKSASRFLREMKIPAA